MRLFYDVRAMYWAIELEYPFRDVCSVLAALGLDGICVTDEIKQAADMASPRDVVDGWLFSIVNHMREMYLAIAAGDGTPIKYTPQDLAYFAADMCELIGAQLELMLSCDTDYAPEINEMRYSHQQYAELVAVFACIARRHTKERKLSIELCQCGQNFRVRCMLNYQSDRDREQADTVISAYSAWRDGAIILEGGEISCYEAIPAERLLEVVGLKQDF